MRHRHGNIIYYSAYRGHFPASFVTREIKNI